MFGKTDKLDDRVLSVIAPETFVQGTMRTHGSLRVDGKIEGNIYDANHVVVGEHGQVQGDIVAESVIVGGKVTGNIQAGKLVQILGKGQVFGDVRTKSLHIEDGAIFEGTCTMNTDDAASGDGKSAKKGHVLTPLMK